MPSKDTSSFPVHGYAAMSAKGALRPYAFKLGALGAGDVDIRVTHCGICHSDVAMIDNDWGFAQYPIVPGHEVVGVVERIGAGVKHVKIGQRVGIGWQCSCCGGCEWCVNGHEQLCGQQGATIVGRMGGWADFCRVDERFAIPIPDAMHSVHAGPLMCAGSTVFSPMLHHKVRAGMRTAVHGIGGLGHLAVQFLAKLGCEVTAISSSRAKEAEARSLGATDYLSMDEPESIKNAHHRFDFVMSTVTADSPWNMLIETLRPRGKFCIVGVPDKDMSVSAMGLLSLERELVGGRVGSPGDSRAMVEFAAARGVKPMVETFAMKDVGAAVDRVRTGKMRYRVVLIAG